MSTLDDFFAALSRRMGWEPTPWRLNVFKTMAQMEGTGLQAWNPLDTTHPFGAVGNWNSVGVKIYPDMKTGVEATARTLQEPQYAGLVATMKAESPQPGVEQGLMTWGWQANGQLSPAGQQILGAMGGRAPQTTQGGENMADPTLAKYIWIEEQGWAGEPWSDPDDPSISLLGEAGKEYYKSLPASDKKTIDAAYLAATGQSAGEGAMTAYEAHLANEDELTRAKNAIETLIDLGVWDADRAVAEWTNTQTAIQNRMGEAGQRGQYVAGLMEDRAKRMTPTEDFPGFEAGGLASQIMGRRGLTAPTLKGTPMSALPDPWEAFRQGNVSVGLPAEAEGIPAYPQATNPYAAAMPGMESLAGGFNPFQAFQSGASGGASVPYTGGSADVRTPGLQPRRSGPDLGAWLEQFGIRLPGL